MNYLKRLLKIPKNSHKLTKTLILVLIFVASSIFALTTPANIKAPATAKASHGGNTYYVDAATGDDSSAGTSAGSAWASIGKANSTVAAGDTVIVSGGTYEEAIKPAVSGTANDYITYVAKAGETPIIRQVYTLEKQYIRIIGFEITHNSTAYNHAVIIYASDYIELLNNNIHHTYGQAIRNNEYYGGSTHITIRGNTIAWAGCPTGVANACVGQNAIMIQGSNFLIEYNDISHTLDFIGTWGGYNIIRNNYLYDYSASDFPDGSPPHVDTWQPYDAVGYPMTRNVLENNYASDNMEGHSHFMQVRDEDRATPNEDAIVRGNVAVRFGSGNQWGGFDYARIYNNTFSDHNLIANGWTFTWFSNEDSGADVGSNNSMFNNIIYNGARNDSTNIISVADGQTVDVSNNACELGTDEGCSVTANINFTDYDGDDFTVQSSSAARNAGRTLQAVTSATGSGTSFTVDDAGFFVGGTGLVDAAGEEIYDTIIVGSNPAVKITNLNLDTNTITVASSISWNNGDPIVLAYQDSTPDIGAYPYRASSYTVSGTWSKSGDTVTVTPNDSSLVRFVEVYEDGLPVGADNTAPYTISGVGDGTVTAKIYSLYASTNPVVNATENSSDTTAPTISNVSAGSITDSSVVITWTTNEAADSKVEYGLTASYGSATTLDTDLVSSHSQSITGLSANTTYHFQVLSTDASGNGADSSDYTFTTEAAPDTTAPSRSSGSPTGSQSAGTTQVTLSLTTNESSTCKYSTSAGTSYNSMSNTFSTTGGASHSTVISGLSDGQSYNYYVRCTDGSNANDNDYTISFSIDSPASDDDSNDSGSGGSSGGGGGSSGGGGGGGSFTDTTAPNQVSNFVANSSDNQALLSWTNPTNSDFAGVKLYRKSNSAPSSQTDAQATLLYQGTGTTFTDTVGAGELYYYSIYTYDTSSNYSAPRTISLQINQPDNDEESSSEEVETTEETTETTDSSSNPPAGGQGASGSTVTSLIGQDSTVVEQVSSQEANFLISSASFVPLSTVEVEIFTKITKLTTEPLPTNHQYEIATFIHTGSPTTLKLGAGERAGSIASFQSAFGRLPASLTDWQDIIKIANGRWTTQRNSVAEDKAKNNFKTIYLRDPDMSHPHDNAAVNVMAYGLRPANRNLDSEKAAILSFKHIYQKNPVSALDWDLVRAIAYSGATR